MDPLEYNYIRRQILALVKVDLNCYKAPQMQRRLQVYLVRSGHANWPKFFRTIQNDSAALRKFRDYLTINVSSFFRDPDKYKHLETVILPELLGQCPTLRVWSAGCSHGQEAYSLAMLLAEATKSDYRHQILATDIDSSALEKARAGGPYTLSELTNIPPALLSRHFSFLNNSYWVKEELRRKISFRQHNLLADPIAGGFDLIVCRNVVIYFEPAAKDELYHRFFSALRPGGIFFVGGTEIISKATPMGFENAGISFYRRNGLGRGPIKSAELHRPNKSIAK
jgi:chemotaxis protein methyltransferase CheR